MFKKQIREILNLVLIADSIKDVNVLYGYDSNTKSLGVTVGEDAFVLRDDKYLVARAGQCRQSLLKLIREKGTELVSEQRASIRTVNTIDIMNYINDALRELQSRGCYVIDFENPDCSLDHIEYHAAETWGDWGKSIPPVGDGSDNLYCFFEEVPEC